MFKFLLPLAVLIAAVSLTGCGWGKKEPKSSGRLYEGNGPSIHFNDEPETAGGPLNPH